MQPGPVRGSFQYLVNSWTTIVELLSIYKRLRTFESVLDQTWDRVRAPTAGQPDAALQGEAV